MEQEIRHKKEVLHMQRFSYPGYPAAEDEIPTQPGLSDQEKARALTTISMIGILKSQYGEENVSVVPLYLALGDSQESSKEHQETVLVIARFDPRSVI